MPAGPRKFLTTSDKFLSERAQKNPWLQHVDLVWGQNPELSYKEALQLASKSWRK